ncbi:hypothetical protein ACJJTC_013931 [Scirpophaga incertulas]
MDSCSISITRQGPRVIIVGAGLAWLSAAHRLAQCGIRNFNILEAKERPASQDRLLQVPLPRLDPSRGLFCTSEGRAVDLPVTITAYHTFRQIEQQAASFFRLGGERQHGTLLYFVGLRIQQELYNFSEDQRYDAARGIDI